MGRHLQYGTTSSNHNRIIDTIIEKKITTLGQFRISVDFHGILCNFDVAFHGVFPKTKKFVVGRACDHPADKYPCTTYECGNHVNISVAVIQVRPPGYFTHISITTPIVSALKNYCR
jgi:hypothetical protein